MNLGKDPEFISSRQVSRMPILVWVPSKRPWDKSLGWFVSPKIVNSEGSHRSTGQSGSGLRTKTSQWCSWHGAVTVKTQFCRNTLRCEQWVSRCPTEGGDRHRFSGSHLAFMRAVLPWIIMSTPGCSASQNIPTGLPKCLGRSAEASAGEELSVCTANSYLELGYSLRGWPRAYQQYPKE